MSLLFEPDLMKADLTQAYFEETFVYQCVAIVFYLNKKNNFGFHMCTHINDTFKFQRKILMKFLNVKLENCRNRKKSRHGCTKLNNCELLQLYTYFCLERESISDVCDCIKAELLINLSLQTLLQKNNLLAKSMNRRKWCETSAQCSTYLNEEKKNLL